jgi:F-box/TPR repeat protein Pof3
VALQGWTISPPFLDLTGWTLLEHLDLSNTQLNIMPKLPPTLRHLVLSKNPHLDGPRSDNDELPALPMLETLDCSATALSGEFIKALTFKSIKDGNLKRLSIGDRLVEWRGGPVEDEYPASNSVEELSLASLLIWEQRLLEVVKLYPNLRKLDVSGTKITGVAVRYFVEMGIIWLKLDECNEVSTDAVEWARGQDVEVEFNFPSRSVGRINGFRDSAFAGTF